MLEHATLRKVVKDTSVLYEPDPVNTRIVDDKEWVQVSYELSDIDPSRLSPWLLRMNLNLKKMTDTKLEIEQIAEKISKG